VNETARKPRFTFAQYLEQERTSDVKHAFFDGEIFAMERSSIEHGRLTARLTGALFSQSRSRPCEGFSSAVRVRVLATGFATYPDISVVCDRLERDPEDANTIANPILLVEVLSEATEAHDRGEKFAQYRRIPSLQEYVLVSQDEPRVEVFRRNADGKSWTLQIAVAGQSVSIASIGCELAVDSIYAKPLEPSVRDGA
jgi:Uma2 family endonuclease